MGAGRLLKEDLTPGVIHQGFVYGLKVRLRQQLTEHEGGNRGVYLRQEGLECKAHALLALAGLPLQIVDGVGNQRVGNHIVNAKGQTHQEQENPQDKDVDLGYILCQNHIAKAVHGKAKQGGANVDLL